MKSYDYIIFDIDDTLLNYENAEPHIFKKIFELENKNISENIYKELWNMSWHYWHKYKLEDTNDIYIQQEYHSLYKEYLNALMNYIRIEYQFKYTEKELTDFFVYFLMQEAEEYNDTESVLLYFKSKASLAIASNGLGMVQRARINKHKKYFSEIFISEELGCIKACKNFWDKVFKHIRVSPSNCLMVGDSIDNDIACASLYGMDTCWVNRSRKSNLRNVIPTYEINNLKELMNI